LTSKVKGYPFEVELPDRYAVSGVILSDQVKSLDWRSRKARLIDRVSPDVIAMVIARVLPLVEPDTSATL
jgi:mRNA interferase MazF